MPYRLKNMLTEAAARMGYSVVPAWRMERHAVTEYMKSLFELLAIDCVLDVGANQGQYRNFLRSEVEFTGTIVSFEPIPRHVAEMRARADTDAKWIIEGYALGDTPGKTMFNVMVGTQFSSFLQPDHSVLQRFQGSNDVQEKVEVEIRTLDSALRSLEQRGPLGNLFLKMDTQGFDLEVLKGGAMTLQRVCALQSEASVKPIYVGMPSYTTTIEAIQALDFELSGIYPNNAGHFPLLVEFDCYFIAKRCVPEFAWRG